jgi:hypothetical protein
MAASLPGFPAIDIEVAGEAYHLDAFTRLFAAAGRPLGGVVIRNATLIPEPTNPYDRNAVAVYIDGLHVGYVPAEDAPRIQPIAFAHNRSGRHLTVLARVWACCEDGDWSARVTLSFSGEVEDEWSYVDRPSWPGGRSPDGSQRLTQTGLLRQLHEAEDAGLVRGQNFESLRPDIAQAKADGDREGALRLLGDCVDAAERCAKVMYMRPTAWPTEQAAILLRSMRDYAGEVAVLERFLQADPSREGTKTLRERLIRARTLAGMPIQPQPDLVATDTKTAHTQVRLNVDPASPGALAVLPVAAELVRENEFEDAIRSIFADAGVPLGTALETHAVLQELSHDPGGWGKIAAYIGGDLVGYVGALYSDLVREVVRQAGSDKRVVAVRCRIYAAETPKWTARITLGPYEDVVAGIDDSQSAAEGRAVAEQMARLREQRLATGGQEADEQRQRLVRGKDFIEWVEPIKQLRRDGRDDEALRLLAECIDVAECDARRNGWQPPTWYTEQAAIILRKNGNRTAEVALLERFLAACPNDRPQADIAERLVKARARLK